MVRKKIFVSMLALTFSLSAIPLCEVHVNGSNLLEVSAAINDQLYSSQFNNITLTKGYKDLNYGNPCMTQRFTADPGVMEYNGRMYVYTTNDSYMYDSSGNVTENNYSNIKTINCMSSSEMINWTDHGTIDVAGSSGAAKWARCS